MRNARKKRREALVEKIKEDPFLTDHQLAKELDVSVATIRLDRMALDIPELRERAKTIAASTYTNIKALQGEEVIGDLVELSLGHEGTSVLEVDEQMVFERNQILRGHYLFAQGNSLAIALVDSDLALTKSSNVRFYSPVKLGDRVVCRAVIDSIQGNRYLITVDSRVSEKTVFRGEYIVVDVEKRGGANNA